VNFLEQMLDVEKLNKRTRTSVLRKINSIKPQNYSQQRLEGFIGLEKVTDASNHFLLSTIPPEKLIANLNNAYHVQSEINRSSRLTKLQPKGIFFLG
jgi:hypothetical protein